MPTNPGFHLDFALGEYPKALHPAIRKIATRFYVTRAFKPITLGNSVYWAILVRPTDEFSIYINTDREVVILLSQYETFEIRTLEAFEEFYDLLESQRVDRSVRFLVSNDNNIESSIKHYLDQHPEYPIIVPITFDLLVSRELNPLLDAVRRNYLLRDLFGYQNPLREETFFFGRHSIVNAVLDMAKSGQNSSLFGLRKSGKTSAIYAIQRRAKGLGANVTLIDCQNTSVHGRRFNDLLAYIVFEVRKSVGIKRIQSEISTDIALASDQFYAAMNNVLSQVKGTILIIFDEIENISPGTAASPHWRSGEDTVYFWQILRSYLQAESRGKMSICLVGTSPHILETSKINGIDNPIYLYAPKTYIPSLTFDETREMVTRLGYFMGLEFDPMTIAELQKEFGGHPFFTRQVCSTIHQQAPTQRPHKVSVAALHRANVQFSGQLESYLRDIVGNLQEAYPDEFRVLEAVVNGDKAEATEYGLSAPDLIDHLIGYGLIAQSGDDFDVRFDAVKPALKKVSKSLSLEDRWAEISRRRNALEPNIRSALYFWSRAISSDDWNAVLSDCLTVKRLSDLSSSEPAVLFSRNESPLYFSDLLMFIKDKHVLPYLGDTRSEITRKLDTVNKARADAHSKSVSDADMLLIRQAFEHLETEFTPP
ncbi:hypothetical protein [Sphingobium sp. KCTC 72723]|uniref:hypothetical protein n=1 Tax=Sphingobium sp. KCTC 72723 TaxID=2733867 RepID=UPI00165D8134|nr:hypothetical protein [Sphingobium sp. KCTC 72723]